MSTEESEAAEAWDEGMEVGLFLLEDGVSVMVEDCERIEDVRELCVEEEEFGEELEEVGEEEEEEELDEG